MIGKITEFEVRLKYKFDTGENATYGKGYDGISNYAGGLTPEYAEWMEWLLPNNSKPRELFMKTNNVGEGKSVYYATKLNNKARWKPLCRVLIYSRDYKLWLEQYIMQMMNEKLIEK